MLTFKVQDFPHGLVNTVEDQAIPNGAASNSKNWLTMGDHIELRRGMDLYGTEITGSGKSDGVHVTYMADGTQILYRKRGRKLEYYDDGTDAWLECGTDLFPAAAVDDELSADNYATLSGAQMWVSTPNSGLYKIMTANPGSYTDMTDTSKNFKGRIKIKQNRMFLWHRNEDKSGIYGSYIDTATYTPVSAESIGTGDGSDTTFSGTLAFKGGGAKRTCFGVTIKVGGTTTLTDDYNGYLEDSNGVARGTINYTTGAYDITFAAAPANLAAITADYQWEDSTNTGIADFSKSTPRQAAQGFVFRQDDGGGDAQMICSYDDTEFCFHEMKTWRLTLTATDTNATNLVWRDRVGIPNWRAAIGTGSGIYYIDDTDKADPQLRLAALDDSSTEVIPVSISKRRAKNGATWGINLKDFIFDQAVAYEWGEYILFACRTSDSTQNNRVIIFNKLTQSLDIADYTVSCFATYDGNLVAGDSISDNVYELFSGFDDDDSLIDNYWEGSLSTLDIEELKKCKKLVLQGRISAEQSLSIYASVDNGDWTLIGTLSGDGTYVDRGQAVRIGARTIGRFEIGGGGDGLDAYNYEKALRLQLDKFYQVKLRFVANALGYVSINRYRFYDLRLKGNKIINKYR